MRHTSLLKVGHAVVLQEKYHNLRALEITHVTMKTLQVFRLRQKSALRRLRGFGFAYRLGGGSHRKFPFGSKVPRHSEWSPGTA